jgi:alpha-2-macroglobulin
VRSLQASLRSDWRQFVSGEDWYERTTALRALASAGKYDPAYFASLSRSARYQEVEGVAGVVLAGQRAGQSEQGTVQQLARGLSDAVVLRLWQGRDTYAGFRDQRVDVDRMVLPSEARSIAEVARALGRTRPDDPKIGLLVDALVTMGDDDGWGTTNANASALIALAERLEARKGPPRTAEIVQGSSTVPLRFGGEVPVGFLAEGSAEKAVVRWGEPVPGFLWAEASWVPAGDGSQVAPPAHGFAVTRELLVQQPGGAPPKRIALDRPGTRVDLRVGDVVEEHVQVVSPEDRWFVAIEVPLAAGMEPLNPALATAPPEARPSGRSTARPTYVTMLDDRAGYYFEKLPKGTWDLYFRTRASFEGSYVQPAARAELMYDAAVLGNSAGARIAVGR